MAVIFGNGIQAFKVNLDESGYAIVQSKGWFSSFMIANGGYLGSLLFALLILVLGRTAFKKYLLGTLGLIFLGVTAKFSGVLSFAFLYAVIFTAIVLVIYMIQNEKLNDWAIDVLGISSVAYAIYDTFVDTILLQINLYFHVLKGWHGSRPVTDAMQLAQLTKIPAIVWGVIWLVISILAVKAVLLKSPKGANSRK